MSENNIQSHSYLELPAKIAFQEEKIAKLRNKVKLKKLENSVKKARKVLQASALKNLNYQQQLARVTVSIERNEAELIELETELQLAEVKFNCLSNQFLAERKQISYRMAEMKYLE